MVSITGTIQPTKSISTQETIVKNHVFDEITHTFFNIMIQLQLDKKWFNLD